MSCCRVGGVARSNGTKDDAKQLNERCKQGNECDSRRDGTQDRVEKKVQECTAAVQIPYISNGPRKENVGNTKRERARIYGAVSGKSSQECQIGECHDHIGIVLEQ